MRTEPTAGHDTDLSSNTTTHLTADIERQREHLGIAMAHRAISSGSRTEIDWITRDMRRIFPREWEECIAPVPARERNGNLAAA